MSHYSTFEASAKIALFEPSLEQVLIVKYREYGDQIGMPGGHLNDNGEQPREALGRELYEELGIYLPDNTRVFTSWRNGPDKSKGFGSRLILGFTGIRADLELPEPPTTNEKGFWNPVDQLPDDLGSRYHDLIIGSVAMHRALAVSL